MKRFTLFFFVMVVVLCCISSCATTQYVPVVEYHTDTLIKKMTQRDSIHVHDSIRVTEKGDTVTIDRWHTKYRDRWHHDSIYIARHDTIPQPYPVTEYVERKRSWVDWLFIVIGVVTLFGGIIWLVKKIKKYLII